MAIKVVLTNKSQQTQTITTVRDTDSLSVSRIFYQYFRSLTKAKVILEDYNNNKIPLELREIIDKFNVKSQEKITDENIKLLDKYLGNLGETQEYHYKKDMVNIEPWLDVETKSEFRNVISKQLDTSMKNYNVVTSVAGQDYNIIHKS